MGFYDWSQQDAWAPGAWGPGAWLDGAWGPGAWHQSTPRFAAAALTGTARAATHEVYGTSAGNWLEEALTNGVASPDFSGATSGTVGSGGSLPTNWTRTAVDGSGLSVAITKNGTSSIDIRFFGTGAAGNFAICQMGTAGLAAAVSDIVTGSFKIQLLAGSMANITAASLGPYILEYSSGSFAAYGVKQIQQLSTDIPAFAQITYTMSAGNAANLALAFIVSGGAVDVTFRITSPQLEKRNWRSTFAASRPADSLTHTMPAFPWTIDITADMPRYQSAGTLCECGSGNNRITLRHSNYRLYMTVVSGGTTLTDTALGYMPPCARFKLTMAAQATRIAASLSGKAAATASITLPAVTAAQLGNGRSGYWNSSMFVPNVMGSAMSDGALAVQSRRAGLLFDDFDRADSSALGTAPTGQAWTQSGGTASSITSKKLVAAAGTTGAAYAIAQLSGQATYAGALFDFTSASSGGAAGLIAATNSYGPDCTAFHGICSDGSERWQTVTAVANVPTFNPVEPLGAADLYTFPTAMARDGATQNGVCWMRSGSDVYWVGAQGDLIRKTNSDYAAKVGDYAVFEHYWQSGQCKPEFIAVAAS